MRDELEKYNDYLSEIKRIDRDIIRLKKEEVSVSGSNFNVNGDIRPQGYMSSNVENKVIGNADRIKSLELRKEEIKAHLEYLDSLINTLKYSEKNLLKMYFIEKKDMSIIENIFNRDSDSIHTSISTYIKKLDKKYKK